MYNFQVDNRELEGTTMPMYDSQHQLENMKEENAASFYGAKNRQDESNF